MQSPILKVRNLTTSFMTPEGNFNAIEDVSYCIKHGETVGIVGESGCGKSVTALSIMRLLDRHNSRIQGEIWFNGENLLKKKERDMRKIRGNSMSMIFQEPMTSLNPLHTIGRQLIEVYRIHQKIDTKLAKEKSIEMLKRVRIPSPEKRMGEYPHQLSGGMRQRVMIAMALACNPKLLIADEPTTALDVTIQAQILNLMKELKEKSNTGILMITHDLGVVAEIADRIVVMYAGQVIESASVEKLFEEPLHPYTVGLLQSVPQIDTDQKRLKAIKGMVPSIYNMPKGCRFAPRCVYATEECRKSIPEIIEINNHKIRCLRYMQ